MICFSAKLTVHCRKWAFAFSHFKRYVCKCYGNWALHYYVPLYQIVRFVCITAFAQEASCDGLCLRLGGRHFILVIINL